MHCVALRVLVVVDAESQIRVGETRQGFVQRGFHVDSRLFHFQQGQGFVAVLIVVAAFAFVLVLVVLVLVVVFIFVNVPVCLVTMLVFMAMRVAVPRYAVFRVELAYRHTEKAALADKRETGRAAV